MIYILRITFRQLFQQKVYTSIILLSLVAGLVCSNILIPFLVLELKTDSFHHKKDFLFQLYSSNPMGGPNNIGFIPGFVNDYLLTNYAEVKNVCSISGLTVDASTPGNESFSLSLITVDSSFTAMFDFPIEKGADTGLSKQGLILSQDKATMLFKEGDALGKMVTIDTPDTSMLLMITAIVGKFPEKSHLKFDGLVHHSTFPGNQSGGASYVLLGEESNVKDLQQKVNQDPKRPGLVPEMNYFLEPITKSYFSSSNSMEFMTTRNPMLIWIGGIVCLFILFITFFNFINLFTLSLQEGRKEIGIRKALGISTWHIAKYSASKVFIFIVCALLLSGAIAVYLLPGFNETLDTNVLPDQLFRIDVTLIIAGLVVAVGLLTVLTSLFYSQKLSPVKLLSNSSSSKVSFSKSFFIIQFIISTLLILCSIVIFRQVGFLQNYPLGFKKELIQLQLPKKEESSKLITLKKLLSEIPEINKITVCSGNPVSDISIARYELSDDRFYSPYLLSGDEDLIGTLEVKIIEGHALTPGSQGKLVNEKLLHLFDITDAIGATIPGSEDKIAGVVENFTCISSKNEIPPVIISYQPKGKRMLINYDINKLTDLIPKIRSAWLKLFDASSFSYKMLDQELLQSYQDDIFLYEMIISLSIVSIFLSCFGLFAVSWAVVRNRTKEVGIRKVLGATPFDIFYILNLTFFKRIGIAFALALPLAYYLMDIWLGNFVNKVSFGLNTILIAVIFLSAITIATVSLHTVKAALINPINELKEE